MATTRTFCDTDRDCPQVVREALRRIEAAAGDYACSHFNPCGLAAYYDEGNDLPWRLADDHARERFATAAEAEEAAAAWAELMQNPSGFKSEDWLGYLAPAFRDQPNALDFELYLDEHLDWDADHFGSGYAWETDVPPRERWAGEVADLNKHLATLADDE